MVRVKVCAHARIAWERVAFFLPALTTCVTSGFPVSGTGTLVMHIFMGAFGGNHPFGLPTDRTLSRVSASCILHQHVVLCYPVNVIPGLLSRKIPGIPHREVMIWELGSDM